MMADAIGRRSHLLVDTILDPVRSSNCPLSILDPNLLKIPSWRQKLGSYRTKGFLGPGYS